MVLQSHVHIASVAIPKGKTYFLASFLLHAKYKLSFPVESALVRQRVVFFFFVRRAKRARDGNEKRETASLCTDPPLPPLQKKRRNRVFLRGGGGLYTGQETVRGPRRNREKTNKQKLVSGFQSEF